MSYVVKSDKPKPVIEKPKAKRGFRVLPDIELDKLAAECRVCQRLKRNGGSCGGRMGQNMCLAFIERTAAKLRGQSLGGR